MPLALLNKYLWLAYLIQVALGVIVIHKGSDKRLSHYFSPSMMTFIYFGFSFTLGAYCVYHGISLKKTALTPDGMGFDTSIRLIALMTLGGQSLLLLASLKGAMHRGKSLKKHERVTYHQKPRKQKNMGFVTAFSCVSFLLFSFIPFDLSFLGGSGSFSYPIRLAAVIGLYTGSLRYPFTVRLSLFLCVLAASVLQSYHSKREILFVIIAAAMIELSWNGWKAKFTLKQFSLGLALVSSFIFIVLWSSILRGYGGYNYDSPADAITYIPEYVNESYFLAAANENFELSHAFGNTAQCIDLVVKGDIPYQYGSTFAKVLFVPIPRSLFPHKPRSLIDVYTAKVAPNMHKKGGSIPVTLFGELFTNFHLFGLLFVYPLFRLLDQFYYWFTLLLSAGNYNVFYYAAAFLSATTIQFSRGSGLEIHLIYVVVAIPFMYLLDKLRK